MIKTIILALSCIVSQNVSALTVEKPEMNIAEATATETPAANLTQEEPVVTEETPQPVEEVPIETQAEEFYSEPQEELPTPADEFAYADQTYLGTYTVTWYSREEVGYDAPGASGNGLTPGYSCAMPDYSLLNHTVLVEGFGIYHVDDVSPSGICDLYVGSNAEIPGYGTTTANVYIVG